MSEPARTWRVLNLELGLDEPEHVLRERAAAAAGIELDRLRGFRIARKSVDARRRGRKRRLRFIVHADLVVDAALQRLCVDGQVVVEGCDERGVNALQHAASSLVWMLSLAEDRAAPGGTIQPPSGRHDDGGIIFLDNGGSF